MLYPYMTQTRTKISLDGIWDFKLLNAEERIDEGKSLENKLQMPVPSSYNDIYPGREFRNHVGKMAYQREFFVTKDMTEKRLVLHFSSVTHKAEVFVNGIYLGGHKGGFLPFEFDVKDAVKIGKNLLTVIVDNIIDNTTLPAGRLIKQNFPGMGEKTVNLPNFDFFNYTGIMRPVCLYSMPDTYISDISIQGDMYGTFSWEVCVAGKDDLDIQTLIRIYDRDNVCVYESDEEKGQGTLEQVKLWDTKEPYLYKLEVILMNKEQIIDQYIETFGFRTISISNCWLHLNGKQIYLKGFGKHEDSYVRGRGFDQVYNVKDIALLKWIGANSFRTSHYPYSEEMLNLCDKEGILIIDEAPAVGLHTGFSATGMLSLNPKGTWEEMKTFNHHKEVLSDLVSRDKNHPCVIMWSIANEPASEEEGAKEYFEPLVNLVKEKDIQNRPVTVVTYEGSSPEKCKIAELCDVLVINRYRGWYDTEGNLEGATALLKDELERFHLRCPDKPIMLGEYGADTISGMHDINEGLFSEEYQVEFIKAYGRVFDELDYITGEHIWNFADFATAENIKRVQGNKKGIFTREREPKMAAYYIRKRWRDMDE